MSRYVDDPGFYQNNIDNDLAYKAKRMGSPYENRRTATKNPHGRRAEKDTAKRLGLRQTVNSGASGDKGDLKNRRHRGENKSTTGDSFSVKHAHLDKISQEALGSGRVPFLSFQFVHGDGQPKISGAWVAIPEWYFHELTKP